MSVVRSDIIDRTCFLQDDILQDGSACILFLLGADLI